MDLPRRIAYYELWATGRPCDQFPPEQIAAGALTHINIAFAGVTSDFSITDTDSSMVARIAHLKQLYPGLRVNIAVGGWAFNDPPTQNRFSNMASSADNRSKFITSTFRFLQKYGLDGIDIDWEYPEADDRGGVPADYANYVALLQDFRNRINSENPTYELTITIPASYWYLRHFDIKKMEPLVDWFNLMSYDIHGIWDQNNIWTGPYLKGHTNITEIDDALDLLWRNAISPDKVVMGFGFYGRSFTMSDPNCGDPGCTFTGAGNAGPCTTTEGILTYAEVRSKNYTLNNIVYHYDPVSTVKYEIYDGNQWISYDDAQSFNDKKKFLSERCLGGLMIWAIDQDTQNYDALAGLLGDDAVQSGLIKGGNLSDEAKAELVDAYSEYTGQDCYIATNCTDDTPATAGPYARCAAGYTAIESVHMPNTRTYNDVEIDTCNQGYWHHICCPTEHLPQNCQWSDAPGSNENPFHFCQNGVRVLAGGNPILECPAGKFLLSTDTARNKEGTNYCAPQTRRTLCCDSNPDLDRCHWNECGEDCAADEEVQTTRYSDRYGTLCDVIDNPPNLNAYANFCCPKGKGYKNCQWKRKGYGLIDPGYCVAEPCSPTQLKITEAFVPPPVLGFPNAGFLQQNCGAQLPTLDSAQFPYCCDPDSEFTPNLPVDPAKLWANPHYEDVTWSYSDEYSNNDKDSSFSGPQAYGDDAYGFIMMDGPSDMVSNTFKRDYTVVHADPDAPSRKGKRSIITRDQSIIDSTFDHKEETVYVYCNHPAGSAECSRLFDGGAEDTIIKLPSYIGEGPFGRIVSMTLAPRNWELPEHHVKARSQAENTNEVWQLRFDYNFNLIKRQSSSGNTVNMRIDYTNLLPYWDEMTDSNPSKHKRTADMPPPPRPGTPEFADLLKRAEEAKKHRNRTIYSSVNFGESEERYEQHVGRALQEDQIHRRWFGKFLTWLKKMTTVETKEKGDLSMGVAKSLLIYSARVGCEESTLQAGLDIHADANIDLNAQYAYYLSGTIVPPAIGDTFAYFSVQPSAYIGIRMNGNAILRYQSDRKKLIDTLSYPGLSIRGLAAVGPTLDLYGQLSGNIKIAGQLQIGAQYTFQKSEGYWPRNSDSASYEKIFGSSDTIATQGSGLEPRLDGSVKAEANIDVIVTPEANMGISAFGVVDAQVSAFARNTLRFHVEATASTGGSSYDYGVYYLWNIGLSSHGTFKPESLGLGWNSPDLLLFPSGDQQVKLYPRSGSSKREYTTLDTLTLPTPPRRGLLNPPPLPRSFEYTDMSEAEIWGYAGNISDLGLRKRLDSGDIATFVNGLIQCPNATNCNGPGSVEQGGGSCPINRRQGPGGGSGSGSCSGGDGSGGSGSGQAQSCDDQYPRLMYNCRYFPDEQVNGNGNTVTIPGICTNVRNVMRRDSVDNEYQLVWETQYSRARRDVVCPDGACTGYNYNLLQTVDQGVRLTSCDEFPFASTEEGGRTSGTKSTQTLCVPTYEQDLQGNCNDLMNNVQTNVAYDPDDADATPSWKQWDLGWQQWLTGNSAWNPKVSDANYPEYAPGTRGWGFPLKSYPEFNTVAHHRKFTVSLIDTNGNTPNTPRDFISKGFSSAGWGGTTRASDPWSGRAITRDDVMCAVSTQEAPQLRIASFNGYCNTHTQYPSSGEWFGVDRFKSCRVYFGSGVMKREIIGAEFVEDGPEIVVPRMPRHDANNGTGDGSDAPGMPVILDAFSLSQGVKDLEQ